jgi:hypothetical protein
MKGFRFQPVAWLTTVAAVLVAITAATAAPPLDHVLSHSVTAWLGVATVVVTTVLGVVVHGRVTPTARPRDNDGRPLVPSRRPSAAPSTPPPAAP